MISVQAQFAKEKNQMCSAVSNKEQTETDQSRVNQQSPAGKPTMQENPSSSVVAKECQ